MNFPWSVLVGAGMVILSGLIILFLIWTVHKR